MTNGELAFEEPWQGRVFGMANSLCDAGLYEWSEFQAHLIRIIGIHDTQSSAADDSEYRYYDHFLAAFEALLADKGLMQADVLDARTSEFAARPHGHDH